MNENRLLKGGQLQEHGKLMGKKRELVKRLEGALATVKALRESKAHANANELRSVQDRIMQMLMLDRENEQLLLKQSMGGLQVTGHKVTAQTLQKAYKNL